MLNFVINRNQYYGCLYVHTVRKVLLIHQSRSNNLPFSGNFTLRESHRSLDHSPLPGRHVHGESELLRMVSYMLSYSTCDRRNPAFDVICDDYFVVTVRSGISCFGTTSCDVSVPALVVVSLMEKSNFDFVLPVAVRLRLAVMDSGFHELK